MTRLFAKLPLDILSRKDLRPSSKLVYAAIVNRIGNHVYAWPGYRRIAKDTGLCTDTVASAVRELVEKRLLRCEPGKRGGFRYRLPEVDERTETSKSSARDSLGEAPEEGGRERPEDPDKTRPNKISPNKKIEVEKLPPTDPWSEVSAAMIETTSLRTDLFRKVWMEWEAYREEIGAPLTPSTRRRQIERLESMGHDRAIGALLNSIEAGYKGIYERPPDIEPPESYLKDNALSEKYAMYD